MIILIILTLIGVCITCILAVDAILSICNQPDYAKMAIGDKEYSNLINIIIDNGELCIDKSKAHELVYSCNGTTFYINLNPYSFGNKVIKYIYRYFIRDIKVWC